jgi:hypothetical protein
MITERKILSRQTKTTSAALGAMFLLNPCLAQSRAQITQEAKTATCSNVVVTGGTATFKCSGLTGDQAKLLKDVPALLTRMLKSQQQDTAEILSRLNTCIDQGAARSLSSTMQENLRSALSPAAGTQFSIQIRATNSTSESEHYAEQIRSVFSESGWKADPVFYNMVVGTPVPPGVVVVARDVRSAPGIMIQRAFSLFGVKAAYQLAPDLDPNLIILVVGQKPVE